LRTRNKNNEGRVGEKERGEEKKGTQKILALGAGVAKPQWLKREGGTFREVGPPGEGEGEYTPWIREEKIKTA